MIFLVSNRQTLPAKGGEKGLFIGIMVGRVWFALVLAIPTVSGMTSNSSGLAIREVLVTRTGMNAGSLGFVMFLSLV